MAGPAIPLLAIVGPTGAGKSATAVDVALGLKEIGIVAEVVSADAMQLYAGMDIGTAKISEEEKRGVTHHLLDVWGVDQDASVQDYQRRARDVISNCFDRKVVPILVGGSGLYVSSVVYQFDFPGTSGEVRASLERELEEFGLGQLVTRLLAKNPRAELTVDLNNPRRVVRALEVLEITGQPPTPGLHARGDWWHEPTVIVGIEWPRETLVGRIDKRVDQMWSAGLVAEVRGLLGKTPGMGKTARQAIGYREVIAFLDGEFDEEEAKSAVAQHTKRYARKQMSWFRRDPHVQWLNAESDDVPRQILQSLRAHWPTIPAG